MGTKVTLRQKKLKNGKLSLYLDFYPSIINEKGKETRREFLKMSILEKPKNQLEKSNNKEILKIAEAIASKRSTQFGKNGQIDHLIPV